MEVLDESPSSQDPSPEADRGALGEEWGIEVVSPVVKPRMTPPVSMECQVHGCVLAGGGLYSTLNHVSA